FMGFLDVTIVNIAFPDIRASFPDSSLAGLSWVLNAYNIVFAALLVPAGRLADIVGRRRMVFIGLITFLIASAILGLAGSVRVLGSLAAGLAMLALLVLRSATHRAPVLELSLFRVRSFAVAVSGTFLFSIAFYALLLCNILFLTEVWHYSILKAGFAVTPGPLMAALSAGPAGRMTDRFGPRPTAVAGPLLFASGCALFALSLGSDPNYLRDYLPATLLTGTGVGTSFASFSGAAVAKLPPARFATGSAI